MDTTASHERRSRILNYAIMVELQIGEFLNHYFIDNENKKQQFSELILNKEFFTFEQKIRIFSKIIQQENIKIERFGRETDKKNLIKDIEYIREVRNAIAHNHPFRNPETNDITIKYKHKNKDKEIPLNDVFDKEFFNLYMKVFELVRWGTKITS